MLGKGPQESISMILSDAFINCLKINKSIRNKHLQYHNFQYQDSGRGVDNCGWIPKAQAFILSSNVSKIWTINYTIHKA